MGASIVRNLRPYQVVSYGGGVLFVLSLLTVILSINIFGMGPYIFGVSCHFAFAMSFSFTLWFSMFLFNIFTNFSRFMGFFVLPDLPVIGRMLMV